MQAYNDERKAQTTLDNVRYCVSSKQFCPRTTEPGTSMTRINTKCIDRTVAAAPCSVAISLLNKQKIINMAITMIVLNGSSADIESTAGEVRRNNGEARMGGRRKC